MAWSCRFQGMPPSTKRTPRQLHETLASKYLFGWAGTPSKRQPAAVKLRALWVALVANAADLSREVSQASQDRAREARVMAAKVRRQLEMGGAVSA